MLWCPVCEAVPAAPHLVRDSSIPCWSGQTHYITITNSLAFPSSCRRKALGISHSWVCKLFLQVPERNSFFLLLQFHPPLYWSQLKVPQQGYCTLLPMGRGCSCSATEKKGCYLLLQTWKREVLFLLLLERMFQFTPRLPPPQPPCFSDRPPLGSSGLVCRESTDAVNRCHCLTDLLWTPYSLSLQEMWPLLCKNNYIHYPAI